MLPRPDRNKIHKRLAYKGREVLTATVFGYDNKDSMDNPGGGGKYESFFIQDSKVYYFQKIEQRTKDIHNLENKLKRVREAIRARNIGNDDSSISFEEGTNSNK